MEHLLMNEDELASRGIQFVKTNRGVILPFTVCSSWSDTPFLIWKNVHRYRIISAQC